MAGSVRRPRLARRSCGLRALCGVGGWEHRVDRGAYPSRYNRRGGSVELPVEVQESQAVDQSPHRGRHRFLIGTRKGLPHNGAEILGDGRYRRDPFTFLYCYQDLTADEGYEGSS